MVTEEIAGPVSAASAEARMAADNPAEGSSWEEIVHALRTAEEGRPGAAEVQLRPGGQLVLTGPGRDPQPLSRLPKPKRPLRQRLRPQRRLLQRRRPPPRSPQP